MNKNKSQSNPSDSDARQFNEKATAGEAADNVIDELGGDDGEENEALAEEAAKDLDEVQTLNSLLDETRQQLEKEKKEYMFLMADFDNFRKRVVKEKAEILRNGAEKVLSGLLPIVDDFERGLDATKDVDDAAAVRQGMELIYNKLVKFLADNGVTAMDSTGKDFDPDIHEAIATLPTGDASMKGKVIDTTQKGYMINDKVLRHAKVAVGE